MYLRGLQVDGGARLHERGDGLGLAQLRRVDQRGVSLPVLVVGVRPRLHQPRHRLRVLLLRRQHERRLGVLVLKVDRHARRLQHLLSRTRPS
eukprot:1196361-Prorocentrum_minimum.AAC.4